MSVFAIEYNSYYAYLFYDFSRLTKACDGDELTQIYTIARKYVKLSHDTGVSGHITHEAARLAVSSCTARICQHCSMSLYLFSRRLSQPRGE